MPRTRRLILVRHAKSGWRQDTLPDVDRPLSKRGERDAPEMAARLEARGEKPELIVTSHARRATESAKTFAHALGLPGSALRVERALYLATPGELLAVIGHQNDELGSLMVVGHNPGLTALANGLLPDLGLANLPTAGVVVMELADTTWEELATARGRLLYCDYPKRSPSG